MNATARRGSMATDVFNALFTLNAVNYFLVESKMWLIKAELQVRKELFIIMIHEEDFISYFHFLFFF